MESDEPAPRYALIGVRACELAAILVYDRHLDLADATGTAAPKLAGDESHAESQQEGGQQHEDQGSPVAGDQFDIFEADEEEFFHMHSVRSLTTNNKPQITVGRRQSSVVSLSGRAP
jgi:hypothetical protein